MIYNLVKEVEPLVEKELERAQKQHGPLSSVHEGYAVILEEKEEAESAVQSVNIRLAALWAAVKKDDTKICAEYCEKLKGAAVLAACELIQTAAMAQKTLNTIKMKEEQTQ